MTDKLKPCPFCGGDNILISTDDDQSKQVYCDACYSSTDWYWTEELAALAWNKRAALGGQDSERGICAACESFQPLTVLSRGNGWTDYRCLTCGGDFTHIDPPASGREGAG